MNKILTELFWFVVDTLEVILLAFVFYLILHKFVFELHLVDGDSMLPNLHNKEFLITNKTSKFKGFNRGDIIIFEYPKNPEKEFVKRIIGLPNETIEVKSGKVFIYSKENPSGLELNESYLPSDVYTEGKTFLKDSSKVQIPENNYAVFGDNREVSSDSRVWGFVPLKNIIGTAWYRIWPLSQIKKLN